MKEKIAIIIVTFNNEKDILECIASCQPALSADRQPVASSQKSEIRSQLRIIIVDNASRDNTVNIIRHKFKSIEIIVNKQNVGFAKAVNQGIDKALKYRVDYVGLINPDAKFVKGGFTELIQLFKVINNLGIVAPIIQDDNDNFGFTLSLIWNKTIGKAKHLRVNKLPDKPLEQAIVSGCCMVIKREVLKLMGKFDDQFFLYNEDVDFCLRIKNFGFKIFIDPKIIILHKLNSENPDFRRDKIKYLFKSNIRLIQKHVQWYLRPMAVFYMVLGLLKIIVGELGVLRGIREIINND